jgi:hypothetical protein
LGHISKQGCALLRFLLVETAQVTVRSSANCAASLPPCHAARTQDCQDREGAQTGRSSVRNVAPKQRLVIEARFARVLDIAETVRDGDFHQLTPIAIHIKTPLFTAMATGGILFSQP